MSGEQKNSNKNGINELLMHYDKALLKNGKLEDLDLINRFFHPLRAEIQQGRYDYQLIKALYSATNLLDLKIQILLDRTLQRKDSREIKPLDTQEDLLSKVVNLSQPIRPLARPLFTKDITKAYVELMIYRKKKRIYNSEPKKMEYLPVEIEPISIEEDKEELLQRIQLYKKASIELSALLKVKTWQEVLNILNILLHLAHEGKIKLQQENFPLGKIIITYREGKN